MNRPTAEASDGGIRSMPEGGALVLMERVLRAGRSTTLAAEYPLAFDARFPGRIVAAHEGGEARAACATLVRELVLEGERLRVGLIGSVATDPEWRGRGLATRVLEQAEERLRREGCAAALLWADDPEFYARRGYQPIGRETDCVVPASALAALPIDPRVRALAPDDAAAVHRCYKKHGARVERGPEETAALLGCPGMETLVLQRDRDVAAYACLGRGADFEGVVHEWGGMADDVLALLAEHARRARARGRHAPIAVIAPHEARTLVERLTALDARVEIGVLALAKPLAVDELASWFDRFAAPWRAERDGDAPERGLLLRGPRGACELTAGQALATLFAPRGERNLVREIEAALGSPAPRLPLAPFLWGLDSI